MQKGLKNTLLNPKIITNRIEEEIMLKDKVALGSIH